jgi:DNA replication protein DnaC
MSDTPQVLLAHHLKTLKLPTFLREYDKLARQCAAEGADHVRYLVRLTELELIDRERRMVERRIKQAKFPAVKSLDSFDFKAIASLNKMLVLELARCEYIDRRENVIALGNSGTGKTHVALGLGLAACQKGITVGFITAAALVHELMEARDEKRLLRLQKQLAKYKLLIIDELGFVPLSKTGAELLFEVFSQRYERGSTLVTSNLPFDEWTEVFGSERLTGALLDRLTHHVHILEMNGESSKTAKIPKKACLNANAWLTRWVHRGLPRALLRQRMKRALRRPRGSLLWTTRTTRSAALGITLNGPILRRPLDQIYSAVDTPSLTPG